MEGKITIVLYSSFYPFLLLTFVKRVASILITMKRIVFVFIINLMMNFNGIGQNLVPNPSFEAVDSCPDNISGTNVDEVSRATGWSSYSISPDFYSECATSYVCDVPNNNFGFQYAHTGIAYCGLVTWEAPILGFAREAIGAKLFSNLVIGQKYFLSFFTTCSGKGENMRTDKIGMKFTTIPYSFSNPIPINNSAQLYSTTIITDTVNWIKISGSFIADSSYQYISIGNFFDDTRTDTLTTSLPLFEAYYFVDDICVSTDSIYNDTWTGITDLTKVPEITISPNPATNSITITSSSYIKEMKLINLLGAVVSASIPAANQSTIDISKLSKGIYFVEITDEKKNVMNKKVVVQ